MIVDRGDPTTAETRAPKVFSGWNQNRGEASLSDVAQRLGATPMQVALAWLLRRAPNILLIPGTSSVTHLRENLAAADLALPDDALAALDGVAASAHAA